MTKVNAQVLKGFGERLQELKRDRYAQPVISAIEGLPKDELAVVAETLVNLTSFKRRVSISEEETVGGPIDVAVISKSDGFVWIKRKHYFRPELNPHFFIRFRSANGGGKGEAT